MFDRRLNDQQVTHTNFACIVLKSIDFSFQSHNQPQEWTFPFGPCLKRTPEFAQFLKHGLGQPGNTTIETSQKRPKFKADCYKHQYNICLEYFLIYKQRFRTKNILIRGFSWILQVHVPWTPVMLGFSTNMYTILWFEQNNKDQITCENSDGLFLSCSNMLFSSYLCYIQNNSK